jgi:hypothetical protein
MTLRHFRQWHILVNQWRGEQMTASHPEPISDAASDFTRYRSRKNSKLKVVSIIVAKKMPSAVLASSRRVGSRASCF